MAKPCHGSVLMEADCDYGAPDRFIPSLEYGCVVCPMHFANIENAMDVCSEGVTGFVETPVLLPILV